MFYKPCTIRINWAFNRPAAEWLAFLCMPYGMARNAAVVKRKV